MRPKGKKKKTTKEMKKKKRKKGRMNGKKGNPGKIGLTTYKKDMGKYGHLLEGVKVRGK